MAKDPREQQETDANRIADGGTGKTDADVRRLAEQDRLKQQGGAAEAALEADEDDSPNSELRGSEPA